MYHLRLKIRLGKQEGIIGPPKSRTNTEDLKSLLAFLKKYRKQSRNIRETIIYKVKRSPRRSQAGPK